MASWMYGFCEALRTSPERFSGGSTATGVSGGAINAVCLASGVSVAPDSDFITVMKQTLRRRGSNTTLAVREALDATLPDDVAAQISGRAIVAMVEANGGPWRWSKPLLASEFESKEDVIGAVCASAHLPFLMNGEATASWRGKRYVDAAVSGRGIIHVEGAVHVSICPPMTYIEDYDPGKKSHGAGIQQLQDWFHATEGAPSDAHPWLAPPDDERDARRAGTALPSSFMSVASDVFGVRARKGAGQDRYRMGQEAFRVWSERRHVVEHAMSSR